MDIATSGNFEFRIQALLPIQFLKWKKAELLLERHLELVRHKQKGELYNDFLPQQAVCS